jgi:hypothetical protein
MRNFLLALSTVLLALSINSRANLETSRFLLPYVVRDAAFDPVKPRAFVLLIGVDALEVLYAGSMVCVVPADSSLGESGACEAPSVIG